MNRKKEKNPARRWIVRVFIITVFLSIFLTWASQAVMEKAGLIIAFLVLVVFIIIGIAFDIIGLAIATADEKPFHSMAAHKERGAKQAIMLLKNADRASSFCNDVVGDIAGIVSGSTAAVIVTRLVDAFSFESVITSLIISALVAGLTVGGKAIGKSFAMKNSTAIVSLIGRFLSVFTGKDKR